MDDKLVYFNFAEDPLYGQYVDVLPDPYANTELTRDYSVSVGQDSFTIAINYYTWFTRHYCYTYRSGNMLDIHSVELGPYRDGGQATPSFGLTFTGAPVFENFNVMYNGEQLTSSINTLRKGSDSNLPYGECYDLIGRRLAAPPMHGLYINGGRVNYKRIGRSENKIIGLHVWQCDKSDRPVSTRGCGCGLAAPGKPDEKLKVAFECKKVTSVCNVLP